MLVGVVLGALGGGGAVWTVPLLVYALGQDPRVAITSSLLIVGLTSLAALVPHARAGHVRFGQGLVFGALGIVGSLAGSAASAAVSPQLLLHADPAQLSRAFAVLLLVVAVYTAARSVPALL